MKNSVSLILNGLLGVVFVLSAVFKFASLGLFELNLVDTGFIGWSVAPYAARSIIALELFLGLLLFFRLWLKEFTFPCTAGLLFLFTVYLVIELINKGNAGNCNCFGSILMLTPVESIIKNVALIILILILWRYDQQVNWRFEKLALVVFSLISFSFPYVADPVINSDSGQILNRNEKYKPELDQIYSDPSINRPSLDLRKGKHILACVTLKCPHCLIAAYKLYLIKKRIPQASVYLILNGKTRDVPGFLKETKTANIPHTLLTGKKFIALTEYQVPSIFFLEDGFVVRKVNYLQLDQEDIEGWFDEVRPE